MTTFPPNFGGFACAWSQDGSHALLMRVGKGEIQESMRFTPLNLLQAHALLDALIEEGTKRGHITDEHRTQSGQLPPSPLDEAPHRDEVDKIAGPD